MKVYTEADLKDFEVDELFRLVCPSGDYTLIDRFDDNCIFGRGCIFCEQCSFGNWCIFGEQCSFGSGCIFGEQCNFGKWCNFGERCRFEERCNFGEKCSFGDLCNLENQHRFENVSDEVYRVVKIDRIGIRKGCTYFFKTRNDIYVRCDCFFGKIAQFEKIVNETHANNDQYRREYLEAINYIKAIL